MTTPHYGSDGVISYNFAAINDTATAIGTFEGAMDGALQDLYDEFTKLFAADWQGDAGQACDAARRTWDEGAREIKAALREVGLRLGASAERMAAVDKQIAASM